jgi:hypothetical protein
MGFIDGFIGVLKAAGQVLDTIAPGDDPRRQPEVYQEYEEYILVWEEER